MLPVSLMDSLFMNSRKEDKRMQKPLAFVNEAPLCSYCLPQLLHEGCYLESLSWGDGATDSGPGGEGRWWNQLPCGPALLHDTVSPSQSWAVVAAQQNQSLWNMTDCDSQNATYRMWIQSPIEVL